MGLCVFSYVSLATIAWTRVIYLSITIKSEVWTICHSLRASSWNNQMYVFLCSKAHLLLLRPMIWSRFCNRRVPSFSENWKCLYFELELHWTLFFKSPINNTWMLLPGTMITVYLWIHASPGRNVLNDTFPLSSMSISSCISLSKISIIILIFVCSKILWRLLIYLLWKILYLWCCTIF